MEQYALERALKYKVQRQSTYGQDALQIFRQVTSIYVCVCVQE